MNDISLCATRDESLGALWITTIESVWAGGYWWEDELVRKGITLRKKLVSRAKYRDS